MFYKVAQQVLLKYTRLTYMYTKYIALIFLQLK